MKMPAPDANKLDNSPHAGKKHDMRKMKLWIAGLLRQESGQDLVEYALIAGLIGLGLVVATSNLQHSIANLFSAIGNRLSNMT